MPSWVAGFFTEYKDALVTLSWVGGGISLVWTNQKANLREKRKETRTEVDGICKVAADVLAKCRKYYLDGPSAAEDTSRAAEIAFEVKRILIRTERLSRRNSSFLPAKKAAGEYFDSVTDTPFSSKDRGVFGPDSAVMQIVDAATHNLIDKLEECYSDEFQ